MSEEGVVRERLPTGPPSKDVVISDLEGELFFGAAPELEQFFSTLWRRARETDASFVIIRVKRTRNPDMVCMERIEHFLRDARKAGVTILLCGIRADFAAALNNLRFTQWFPAENLFLEDDEVYSATLRAVRHAYARLGHATTVGDGSHSVAKAAESELYYLV